MAPRSMILLSCLKYHINKNENQPRMTQISQISFREIRAIRG